MSSPINRIEDEQSHFPRWIGIPQSGDGWLRLALFPFKAYATIAWLLFIGFKLYCIKTNSPTRHILNTQVIVQQGYVLCFLILFFGSFVQLWRDDVDWFVTLKFAAASFLATFLVGFF
ncbi:MAG: hypothetical protein AB1705_02275 [Verrucomicrobiota bacterium]